MAVLSCTGDWAWLAKAGNLNRSYSNVEKRPRAANSVPKGICHLLLRRTRKLSLRGLWPKPTLESNMLPSW